MAEARLLLVVVADGTNLEIFKEQLIKGLAILGCLRSQPHTWMTFARLEGNRRPPWLRECCSGQVA